MGIAPLKFNTIYNGINSKVRFIHNPLESSKIQDFGIKPLKQLTGDELVFSTQKKVISLDEVKALFPTGKLDENNYLFRAIKDLIPDLKTSKKIIDLTPELSEKDYEIIRDFMNMDNGKYIELWKGLSDADTIPNREKLALFTRTMRLTKQTKDFIEFDANKWDIVVDGIIRKPREAILPLFEYKINSKEINKALSDLSLMTPEIKKKVDIISQYLDMYVVKKDFTVFRGDKSFNILPIIKINGKDINLAQYVELATKNLKQKFLNGIDISRDVEKLANKYLNGRLIPQCRFMSTAMTESAVKDYAKKIKWKITVPTGTRGTSIESFSIERLNEAEFLGQKDGQLKILSAKYKLEEDLWYFDALIEQNH